MITAALLSLALTTNPASRHVDKMAHFGLAFAGTTVLHVACTKMFDEAEQECLLASNAIMLASGIVWELNGNKDINDVGANVLGQAGASLMIGLQW